MSGDDRGTLRAADRALLGNKTGAMRPGFAVLLKLFQSEGRYPRRLEDVPLGAVEVVAIKIGVPAAAWRGYDWRWSGWCAPSCTGTRTNPASP